MSRILHVNHDDRPVLMDACWWRLTLGLSQRDEHGNVAVQQYDAPEGVDWHTYDWWSGHIDYFDGRSDWMWPFKSELRQAEPLRCFGGDYIPSTIWYLFVLDLIPPDCTAQSKWRQMTYPGDFYLPTRDEPNRWYNQFPKARCDWEFRPMRWRRPAVPAMPCIERGTTGTTGFMGQ